MDFSRFCITGLPRSRTAWLAALMCAQSVETFHEYPPFFDTLADLGAWLMAGTVDDPHGYVDGFAIIHHAPLVSTYFRDNPIVIIQRDVAEVRRSWEAWEGPISDEIFANVIARSKKFAIENAHKPNVMVVKYADLDSFPVIDSIVRHCTGRPLKFRTWQLFHHLKIELHREKTRPMPATLRRSHA